MEQDEELCALKFAFRGEDSRDEMRTHARALREVALLLLMDHPNIIKPRAYGHWRQGRKGNVYLVMEYVDGWTLAQWVERKHPTVREIIRVFRKLASALAYLHARGILHRDLKLANVVIRKSDGEPILIDFGCAIHAHSEALTDVPIPPGTSRYHPPQVMRFYQENKNNPGAHYAFHVADELFALGVMLYEVLTEPRPTEEDGKAVLNSPRRVPTSPHLKNPRVPEGLSALVMELLAREPEDRPESAEAVERELAELEEHKGKEYDALAHAPSEQRAPPEEANLNPLSAAARHGLAARLARHVRGLASWVRGGRKALALGGAVAAAVLAAALGLWLSPGEQRTPPAGTRTPVVASPAATDARAAPAPSASTPPTGQAVVPTPAASAAVPKEGSTVTTEKPDASPPAPTARAQKPQRGAHTTEFLAWCKSFATAGTVTAVTAACPGAQVRPEPFECPPGAWELMDEQWKWSGEGIEVVLDDRYKAFGESWLQSGPVVGVAGNDPEHVQELSSKKPVPWGTRFIGHLWIVPGNYPPVCLVHEGSPVEELKDGTGNVTAMVGYVRPVYRWKPKRPE